MDWARDTIGLSENDLTNVFKYAPGESTIIQMLASNEYKPEISSLEADGEWTDLLYNLPSIEQPDSGLVLLLAKRAGETRRQSAHKVSCEKWLSMAQDEGFTFEKRKATTFSNLTEKKPETPIVKPIASGGGRRGVRTVPFSRHQFEDVTKSFYTHSTIARVISRSDFPIFSPLIINIGVPAYTYNCRSSNAWDMDLALSATYLPCFSLTFVILYGCTAGIEKDIVGRLATTREEANHPLLMAGIFAEFERARHMKLVRSTVASLETKIFEVDHHYGDTSESLRAKRDERNMEKRNAWLDTAYLRNGLISWRTQIEKMVKGVDQMEGFILKSLTYRHHRTFKAGRAYSDMKELASKQAQQGAELFDTREASRNFESVLSFDQAPAFNKIDFPFNPFSEADAISESATANNSAPTGRHSMAATDRKFKARLSEIHEEYEDWIRDCTMRMDGMAMATQWAQGDTNVEIALATKTDSNYMRSMALLTMVFLPGTFLAGVFSMTFFNWNSNDGVSVSGYFWIYIVITLILTMITVGSWYYFAVFRPRRQAIAMEGEE